MLLKKLCYSHCMLFNRKKCTHFDAITATMLYEYCYSTGINFINQNFFYVEDNEMFYECYD